jgi:hypothetical protein
MQIVNSTYFDKENSLNIPLASNDPMGSPSNGMEILYLCEKLEREILLNALGLSLYNEIKAITDINFATPRLKKLIQGDEYEGKVWLGLEYEDSLIANYVYQQFTTETNIRLSATGAKQVNPENATNQTPAYLVASAHQNFIKQYQGEYLIYPVITGNFTDWYGCDAIDKSLFGYLTDKQSDFPEWKPENFRIYETKNSFGI